MANLYPGRWAERSHGRMLVQYNIVIRWWFPGLHCDNIHKGQHLVVSLPQAVETRPVPGDGGAGGDGGDGHHCLPQPLHADEHQ